MSKEQRRCLYLLSNYKYQLNKQQKRTFKGQILSGDTEGFKTGLFNLIKKKLLG